MRTKFHRKIVKDRKEKEQYSINLPTELIKTLQLEGIWVELEIVGETCTIKKIEEKSLEKPETGEVYDLGDETY